MGWRNGNKELDDKTSESKALARELGQFFKQRDTEPVVALAALAMTSGVVIGAHGEDSEKVLKMFLNLLEGAVEVSRKDHEGDDDDDATRH